MKILILILILLFISGCSSFEVHPIGHFLNLSQSDLLKESQENYKASKLDEFVPSETEKNNYYSQLETMMSYRNYLLLECAQILAKEHNLDLSKPVYASNPKWNNVQNWYSTIFNYQVLVNKEYVDTTMECDLVVNNKKEVSEYQIKKTYAKIIKN